MAEQDDDFAALFEASVSKSKAAGNRRLQRGERVEGPVVAITDDTVFVDVGSRIEARIDRSDLENDKGELTLSVGDLVKATVADPGGKGAPVLKVSFGRGKTDVADLEVAAQSGTPIEGEFTNVVKSGLEVDLGGIRAFCPASQVELSYTADLSHFVGQRYFFKVLEIKDRGRSAIVSRKALLEQERAENAASLLERLSAGDILDGIVQTIQPYGVFVDIGGLQGLVHVSEMAGHRVTSPSDLVSVGDKVQVQVMSIEASASGDPKGHRISLSMRALAPETESDAAGSSSDIITATVVKTESFGLLVDTPAGSGLVPTAELDLPPGSDPRRSYQPGQTVDVVLQRKEPSGKLRLSARAVAEVEAKKAFREFKQGSAGPKGKKGGAKPGSMGSLGDLLRGKVDLDAVADEGGKGAKKSGGKRSR